MADRVGQQLRNYRLVRLLGQGSFADVYLGEHLYLKAEAAIKVLRKHLSEADAQSFLKEAQTIARLVHPHIVRIFDFDVHEGVSFLVMDYAPNGTLRQRHGRGVALPLKTIVQYTNQMADALQYAHDHKLIHRDIKPENMLLGRRDELWLSDFGIVQDMQSTLTEVAQEVAGTVAYMAPEQLRGQPCFASDQYALGIVVYEWLCGSRPFQGSFDEMVILHASVPPPSLCERLPAIPSAVEEVVMTALAKNPERRFASVRAFAHALESASSSRRATFVSSPVPPEAFPTQPVGMGGPTVVSSPVPSPMTPVPPLLAEPYTTTDQPVPAPETPASLLPSEAYAVTDRPTTLLPSEPEAATRLSSSVHASSSDDDEATVLRPLPSLGTQSVPPALRPEQSILRSIPGQGRGALLIGLVILIIMASFATYFVVSRQSPSPPQQVHASSGIGVSKMPNGEYIGISDGTFAFDTKRPDASLKRQAANKLKARDAAGAERLWGAALQQSPNDAEALIYLEDQRVLASHAPYITFIVATYLAGPSTDIGQSDLQGAYVAQKEFNDRAELPGGVKVRLLIASSGSLEQFTSPVALKIIQAARADKTIVGVMGWPMSESTQDAIKILAAAHIPMISSTASSDALTGISPYFFRVIPSNKQQVQVGVQYAEHTLHATKAAIFVDPDDTYSREVATDFTQQFTSDGNTVVVTENYVVRHPKTLPDLLHDALRHNPDLIYFAGAVVDAGSLIAALPGSGTHAHVQVMGADRLFGSYPARAMSKLYRLHFTVFNTGHIWESLGLSTKEPPFFTEYPQDFDPLKQHDANAFGYTRADINVMFSYDATLALLAGSESVLAELPPGKYLFSPDDLRQALTRITGSQAIQGVTGQLSFGPDGNVVNKVVILVKFDTSGSPRVDSVKGTFLAGA